MDDKILLDLYYQEGYNTKLILYRSAGMFTGIKVIEDTDWAPPFWLSEKIKEYAVEYIKENQQSRDNVNSFELKLSKSFADLTVLEMSALIMTIEWLGFIE